MRRPTKLEAAGFLVALPLILALAWVSETLGAVVLSVWEYVTR